MPICLSPNPETIHQCAKKLRRGELVAFPTETVYGLGADAANPEAVQQIFKTKNRPNINPLIAHYATVDSLQQDVEWSAQAQHLAEHFWPGPLTLILPKKTDSRLCEAATAGLPTAAVRLPAHPVANALLEAFDGPLVAPSANPSGYLSPVTAAHVARMFHRNDFTILDGGKTQLGLESTVVDLSGPCPALLRYGALSKEKLEAALPGLQMPEALSESTPKSPGLLLKHYAPRKPLRFLQGEALDGEALIYWGARDDLDRFVEVRNLSSDENPQEAAANIFDYLHALDQLPHVRAIAITPLPRRDLGIAVMDRLERAVAAKRS